MKYSVQYKKVSEEKIHNLEVSVEDYEELVRWLEVLYKLEAIEDLKFSQLEEKMELQETIQFYRGVMINVEKWIWL